MITLRYWTITRQLTVSWSFSCVDKPTKHTDKVLSTDTAYYYGQWILCLILIAQLLSVP